MEAYKLPLGRTMERFVDWLVDSGAWFFDSLAIALEWLIDGATDNLLLLPPWLFIVVTGVMAQWLRRNTGLTVFTVLSFLLIWNLGYWEATIETLVMVVCATSLCVLIGVPIGIAAAHRPLLYTLLRPVLDLMQTVPTFVYLIPTLTLFGLGVVPGLIATIVFSIAAPIRLTYLGIFQVPKELVEAGKSFGCSNRQLLWRIELPAAASSIAAGITQCIMLSLSMVVISALVGANGLGRPVVRALNTVDIASGFEAGLAIVLVAIVLDRLLKQKHEVN